MMIDYFRSLLLLEYRRQRANFLRTKRHARPCRPKAFNDALEFREAYFASIPKGSPCLYPVSPSIPQCALTARSSKRAPAEMVT